MKLLYLMFLEVVVVEGVAVVEIQLMEVFDVVVSHLVDYPKLQFSVKNIEGKGLITLNFTTELISFF